MEYVIVYDGECVVCNTLLKWVIKHDSGFFKISPQYGTFFNSCVNKGLIALPQNRRNETIYLVAGNQVYSHSPAIVTILRHCGKQGRFYAACINWFPRKLTDTVYRFVVVNRKRFQRKNRCPLPNAEFIKRMV